MVRHRPARAARGIALGLVTALAAAPLAPVLAAPDVPAPAEAPRESHMGSVLRILLGFGVTSGIKYAVGGLGPAKILPLLQNLAPGFAVPALVAFGMAEAVASIAVFNKVAGLEHSGRQVTAFALASAASAIATPFLLGLGPIGATLVANAGRLVLFNLIARREGEGFVQGMPTLASLRPPGAEEGGERLGKAGVEDVAPDFLWARAPASGGGELRVLYERMQEKYREILVKRGATEDALRRYAAAKATLDRAVERMRSR